MSGVYISGMEMPSGCAECPLEMYYFNTGETRCRATNKTLETSYCPTSYEKRDSDCPLVPVSPHGDLIDKDATMNAILEERGEDTACWFAGIVNDMPAIVPSDKAEEGET